MTKKPRSAPETQEEYEENAQEDLDELSRDFDPEKLMQAPKFQEKLRKGFAYFTMANKELAPGKVKNFEATFAFKVALEMFGRSDLRANVKNYKEAVRGMDRETRKKFDSTIRTLKNTLTTPAKMPPSPDLPPEEAKTMFEKAWAWIKSISKSLPWN